MWLGYAVTSSTLPADPLSNETIDVFYINKLDRRGKLYAVTGAAIYRYAVKDLRH